MGEQQPDLVAVARNLGVVEQHQRARYRPPVTGAQPVAAGVPAGPQSPSSTLDRQMARWLNHRRGVIARMTATRREAEPRRRAHPLAHLHPRRAGPGQAPPMAAIRTIAFVVGAASLGAEISAARLLAPYFGASTIIWANTIATVLVALSVGYAIGGKLADRRADMRGLCLIVLLAAVAAGDRPVRGRPVPATCRSTRWGRCRSAASSGRWRGAGAGRGAGGAARGRSRHTPTGWRSRA